MDERGEPDALNELGARIDKAVAGRRPARRTDDRAPVASNGMALGLRIGLELIVGVAVGVGLGLLLDRWLGSRPWGMGGGFVLGVAAGMVNVYRTVAGLGMAVGYRKTGTPAPRTPDDRWDED
jgi:ATP synthase protein I